MQNKMTKQRRKELAEQYADRIERRNSTAAVIAALCWLCGVVCLIAAFYFNYFPVFLASFVFIGIAWIARQTIRR